MSLYDGWTGDMSDHLSVEDPQIAAVLAAAAAPAEAPLPGEAAALAAFRHAHQPARRLRVLHPADNLKLFAAALCGGVVMVSGVAAAATGTLPLVGSHHASHAHPTKVHQPADGTDETGDVGGTDTGGNGHGSEISDLAHTPGLTGVEKGQTICTAASAGKCQAGTHGKSGDATHGKSGDATHGKSGDATHGKSGDATHGKSGDATHGKSGDATHGKSGDATHGKSGALNSHGPATSGSPHGS
jgi:hypothetical protein